ncbi:MAG: DUF998 domain-containing protein [Planctomycetota bacterium]
MRTTVPLLGAIASVALLVVAAGRYPGGYDWIDQSVSSLFQPTAHNGEQNTARALAAGAVFLFCLSLAIVFATVARSAPTRFHRKTVQIAGIGSMVYAALVVTPMHDLLVGVALAFFVTAVVTLLHGLYLERRLWMLCAGLACLALVVGNAALYYGDWPGGWLPIVQKASIGSWATWLFALSITARATASQQR